MTIEELLKKLEEYPGFPIITDTGHTFIGNPYEDDSEASGKHKSAWISTSGADDTAANLGHEAQHLIDKEGRDQDTLDAMNFDYATMRAKKDRGDSKSYTDHHSEVRAEARELLALLKGDYDKNNRGYESFPDYMESTLRRAKLDKQKAKYIIKFLRDEAGKMLGIDNLPSDKRIKYVHDPSRQETAKLDRAALRMVDQAIGGKRY